MRGVGWSTNSIRQINSLRRQLRRQRQQRRQRERRLPKEFAGFTGANNKQSFETCEPFTQEYTRKFIRNVLIAL